MELEPTTQVPEGKEEESPYPTFQKPNGEKIKLQDLYTVDGLVLVEHPVDLEE